MRDANASRDPSPARPWRRRALLASSLLCLTVLAAACTESVTGPGVAAHGSSSASPGASPPTDMREVRLAYAQCMRDHGVSDFPDPDADGHWPGHWPTEVIGEVEDSPQFQEASDACSSLIPEPSEEELAYANAWQLAVARCMRESGFPSFPDPIPNDKGFPGLDDVQPGSELNPDNPRFQDAMEACQGQASDEVEP